MTPIVFIDTETTSLRPDRRAWEVGMIRRADHRDADQETSFFIHIDDIDLPNADPFALDVGRFWQRHPQAVTDARVGYEVHDFEDTSMWSTLRGEVLDAGTAAQVVRLWTHGAHLVGAVPSFDAEVLAALLRDNWLTPTWRYHLIDVESLAVGWLARKFAADAQSKAIPSGTAAQMRRSEFEPPWSSERLSNALGVELPNEADRHTALGDARWAARIFDRVMAKEEEQG